MVLKIGIHRYTANNTWVLSLKKKHGTKQANQKSFKLFKLIFVIIMSLSFFFPWAATFFFDWDSLMQDWTATRRHEVTRKRSTKRLK